ncbi:hypothetical protein ABW20_dc0101953 [Dactylellina cionopaga]|nr:hypothetical protein ABW20_dc0101953 [Dactylellina cionopaga]
MKVTSILFLAAAALVSAQDLSGVDPCVRACIDKALADAGCKGTPKQIAVCGCKADVKPKLIGPVFACAGANKCSTEALLKAQQIADAQCKALGGNKVRGVAWSS